MLEIRDVLRTDHVVTKSEAWASLQAPTLADLERLAEEAFARLPARFRRLCDGVMVRVEDFPDHETLREAPSIFWASSAASALRRTGRRRRPGSSRT